MSDDDMQMPAPKRTAPPKVKPVTVGNVRCEVVPWGRSRGLGQNGGFVAGVDPKSGTELWLLKVYDVTYDEAMEEDVQDVFIETMKAQGDKLLVGDEKGRSYLVDPVARTVAPA